MFLCTLLCILACLQGVVSYGSHRKDYYLDYTLYPETFAQPPIHGGRVHYLFDVDFRGQQPTLPYTVYFASLPPVVVSPNEKLPSFLDWIHCDVNVNTNQVWLSYHTTNGTFVKTTSTIAIADSRGVIFVPHGTALAIPTTNFPTRVTYVTSRDSYKELIVHIHNYDTKSTTISAISVNGVKANPTWSQRGSDLPNSSEVTLGASEHAVFVFPVSGMHEGSVWSIRLDVGDERAGYGGRLGKEIIIFENWPHGDQCPYPNINPQNFKIIQDLGLDTFFLGGCGADGGWKETLSLAAASQNSSNPFFILPDEFKSDGPGKVYPLDGVAAIFCGDEVDSSPSCTSAWHNSLNRRFWYPNTLSYQGGKTMSYNGIYSGITDIQGMDFYVAACAPHITSWDSTMRIQGAFDYLRNTRNNHMPLTSWSYSQGFCKDCWKTSLLPGELTAQFASTFAAGSKGIMLFESDIRLYNTDSWAAGKNLLASFKQIKEGLRQGDVEGAIFDVEGDQAVMVGVIQTPPPKRQLIAIVISADCSGYNDVLCEIDISAHWNFRSHLLNTLAISLPPQWTKVTSVQEVVNGSFGVPAGVKVRVESERIVLTNIVLQTDITARIFVVSE